jgi:hypothetical protein
MSTSWQYVEEALIRTCNNIWKAQYPLCSPQYPSYQSFIRQVPLGGLDAETRKLWQPSGRWWLCMFFGSVLQWLACKLTVQLLVCTNRVRSGSWFREWNKPQLINVCIEPKMCQYGVLYLQFKASIHTYRPLNRIEMLQSSKGEAIDIKGNGSETRL